MNSLAPKRVIAFLVDMSIYVALWIFFYFNLHLGDYLSWLLASFYLLIKDGLIHGQSIGKFIFKIRVVDINQKKPISLITSIERNLVLAIPNLFRFIPFVGSLLLIVVYIWETYLIYYHPNGYRWGDQFAKTEVVQLESAKNQ